VTTPEARAESPAAGPGGGGSAEEKQEYYCYCDRVSRCGDPTNDGFEAPICAPQGTDVADAELVQTASDGCAAPDAECDQGWDCTNCSCSVNDGVSCTTE
jgi:hypothetical protein